MDKQEIKELKEIVKLQAEQIKAQQEFIKLQQTFMTTIRSAPKLTIANDGALKPMYWGSNKDHGANI